MIEKLKVKREHLTLLSAHGELPLHIQRHLFNNVDPNDRSEIKKSIRNYIAPQIDGAERQNPGYRERVKNSLWYYLHHQPWDPTAIYSMHEPVIHEPDEMLNYYRWAWEELFGGQESSMPAPNDDNFEVEKD